MPKSRFTDEEEFAGFRLGSWLYEPNPAMKISWPDAGAEDALWVYVRQKMVEELDCFAYISSGERMGISSVKQE